MTITIAAALAGLAVIDSTSIGTLVVPLWMLVHPQLRARMVVLYLAVIGLFYWILGVGLLGGASSTKAPRTRPTGQPRCSDIPLATPPRTRPRRAR